MAKCQPDKKYECGNTGPDIENTEISRHKIEGTIYYFRAPLGGQYQRDTYSNHDWNSTYEDNPVNIEIIFVQVTGLE